MPTLTEIKYSQLENRFDSEHYKPEYLEVEGKLEKTKNVTLLRNVVKKSNKTFDPSKNITNYFYYVEIDGINLVDGNFSFAKLKNHEAPSRARKKLECGDILISTVRPNRNAVSLFLEKSNSYVCSTGFCVIKSEKINPYFLFIFLKTKYSVYQLIRNTSAAMYPAVSEEDILNIKIINPPKQFQLHIEKLVKEAFSKRNSADQKYEHAKQLLEKELGLDKLKLKEEKTFEAKFSNLNIGNRFDVEFHKPLYSEIKASLEVGEKKKIFVIKRLKDIDSKPSKGIEIGSDAYADKGYLFLRVSNLSEKEITTEQSSKFIRQYLYEQLKSKYKPKIGEVLYTKDATIGVSIVVDETFHDFIPSGGIVRIKPKDVDPYYLALVLNSLICRAQSERYSIGAVIKHFTFENVKNLKVPILSQPKQEQISKLIRESFDLRKESKALLNSARQEIEEMIENATQK